MALDLGGNKKKKNGKSKYSIVELSLFKPGKKKYSEFDYEEIRKKQLKEDDSSGDDERFHDREALEIVKRLEAKYGGKKDKKGRRLCFGTEDDYMDKRAGYDLEDDFIDDSEAYDELIPSTMDTVKGGFYVNRGKLEFKTKHEEVNDSDISDIDDLPQQRKAAKRSQISSDEELDVIDKDVPNDLAGTSDETVSSIPSSIPPNTAQRMVGAPPSKVRRIALGESANQRAANAIKKRLVGMPPTLLKRKVFQTFATRKDNDTLGSPRIISGEAILPRKQVETEAVSSTSTLSLSTSKSPDKSPSNALPSSETCNNAGISQNTADNSMIDTCNVNAGTSSPKKRPLAPMTETLSNMIAEFKRCTNNLALPGQKKRLQNIHVDMVIAIEEQCLKDGYSLHEKARVAHSLADYCGIQKNSLYARCIKRRDEHKNGAPNLAFLAKSSLDGKRSTAIVPSSSSKPICLTLEQSSTSKTAGSSTLSANKSTSVQNPALSVPTRSNGPSQLPSTSAISSISSSSTAKTSMAPITSLSSTAIVQNPVTPSSGKSNQSWTSQKKLAAQAMITNVATLLPLNEHLGDIQEILKKVVNETITYEDFLKWHEKCKKSVSVKTNIDGKSGVNNVKNNLSSSSSNRITSSANAFSSELGVAVQSKSSASLSSSIAKRISLAQAMATAKLPPRTRPLSLSSAQISEKFESDKQMTLRAVATAIDNSKVAHRKKSEAAAAAGKPAPRFDFLWTENLARALKTQLDLYWSVLLSSDSYAKSADGIVTVFAKEIYPYFRGEIKLSRLLVEYTRRSPEKAFLLACPSVQKLLKDENVDLNNITVLVRKEKCGEESGSLKANPSTPYKPILPVRSSSSDEIQTTSSQNDADVVVIEQGTSNATTSNGDVIAASTSSATVSKPMNIGEIGVNMTTSQMAEISSAMHHLTSLTNDPQKLLVLQQALLMQVMTHNQSEAKKIQLDEKKKDEERKKKLVEQEKETKKRNKDEKKISQKKVLTDAAKEKLLEEKRLRLEEEKRQKLVEKARKAEEERKKRLEEQAEKERLKREEKEKLIKEAAEKKRQEEEERQRLELVRIKVEEEKAKELEQRRQAELREEERKAAQLLEEEILMEEVSSSEVPPEMKLALEEEEEAESIRLKKQEEQVAAVRAATLAAQNQLLNPTASSSDITKVTHTPTPTSSVIAEQKPLSATLSNSQSNDSNSVGYSITQQSNIVRSPITSAIQSSPQYTNPGSYGISNSQGCSNTTVSPQCMMSMTPPLHRSPAVNQQHIVQSPQQHQPVQSPLSSGQNNALNQRSTIQSLPCQQSSNQHHSSATLDHLDNRHSFMQPQSHVALNHNTFAFGMQQQQQQQQQQRQQHYPMQKQASQHQSQPQLSVQQQQSAVHHQPMFNHLMQTQGQPQNLQQLHQPVQHQQMQMNQQQSACVPGQYPTQICQQQLMDERQRLILQQQRSRDMFMLQNQHQQLALQRQQQQQHQQQQQQLQQHHQQHPQQQQQQQFTMQPHDHRAFQMLQSQQTYSNDMRQQEMQQQQQQQHMMNQYAHHHQHQNQDSFGY